MNQLQYIHRPHHTVVCDWLIWLSDPLPTSHLEKGLTSKNYYSGVRKKILISIFFLIYHKHYLNINRNVFNICETFISILLMT